MRAQRQRSSTSMRAPISPPPPARLQPSASPEHQPTMSLPTEDQPGEGWMRCKLSENERCLCSALARARSQRVPALPVHSYRAVTAVYAVSELARGNSGGPLWLSRSLDCRSHSRCRVTGSAHRDQAPPRRPRTPLSERDPRAGPPVTRSRSEQTSSAAKLTAAATTDATENERLRTDDDTAGWIPAATVFSLSAAAAAAAATLTVTHPHVRLRCHWIQLIPATAAAASVAPAIHGEL